MECSEFRERVHDLIDLQVTPEERVLLEQKMASCPCCRATHQEALRLKQLVQEHVSRPAMPAELRSRLSGELRRRRRGTPFVRLAAAAALLLSVGLIFYVSSGISTPIRHAVAAGSAAAEFRELLASAPPAESSFEGDWRREVAEAEYPRISPAMLEALPDLSKLQFVGHRSHRAGSASGVRLDFRLDPDVAGQSEPVVVCLFLLDAKQVDLASDSERTLTEMRETRGHCCRCFEVSDETVICFSRGGALVSVVSTLATPRLREALGITR